MRMFDEKGQYTREFWDSEWGLRKDAFSVFVISEFFKWSKDEVLELFPNEDERNLVCIMAAVKI